MELLTISAYLNNVRFEVEQAGKVRDDDVKEFVR